MSIVERAAPEAEDCPRPRHDQRLWDALLGEAAAHGRLVGWAAHEYRERIGESPKHLKRLPRNRNEWRMKARAFVDRATWRILASSGQRKKRRKKRGKR